MNTSHFVQVESLIFLFIILQGELKNTEQLYGILITETFPFATEGTCLQMMMPFSFTDALILIFFSAIPSGQPVTDHQAKHRTIQIKL